MLRCAEGITLGLVVVQMVYLARGPGDYNTSTRIHCSMLVMCAEDIWITYSSKQGNATPEHRQSPCLGVREQYF
jgi:hypothetical protein